MHHKNYVSSKKSRSSPQVSHLPIPPILVPKNLHSNEHVRPRYLHSIAESALDLLKGALGVLDVVVRGVQGILGAVCSGLCQVSSLLTSTACNSTMVRFNSFTVSPIYFLCKQIPKRCPSVPQCRQTSTTAAQTFSCDMDPGSAMIHLLGNKRQRERNTWCGCVEFVVGPRQL